MGGRFAVAVTAGAAMLAMARFQESAAAAAESRYLALLATLMLAATAALPSTGPVSRRSAAGTLLPASAVLAVVVHAVLPPGPGRGAVLLTLLALAFTTAAATGFLAGAPPSPTRWARRTALLLPGAIAVQVLYRSGELLDPVLDLHTLVVFAGLPLAAAAAAAFLTTRFGPLAALSGAGAAVLVGSGFHAASTLALLAAAAGELLRQPPGEDERTAGGERRRAPALLWRAAAVAALAAPFAWQPRTAAVATAAAILIATRGTRTHRPVAAAVGLAAAAAALLAPARGWPEAGPTLFLGALLLPLLPAALVAARRRTVLAPAAAAALLAVAAARCTPQGAAVALALVPSALLLEPRRWFAAGDGSATAPEALRRRDRAVQATWVTFLLAAGALAAAYPWLRPEPVDAALAALRLEPGPWSALVVTALVSVPALVALRSGRPTPSGDAAPWFGWAYPGLGALLVLLAVSGLPASPRVLLDAPGVELTADEPRVDLDLAAGAAVGGLVAQGSLAHAAELPAGTPVVRVVLTGGGRALARWDLDAGTDLAEWAARRPDVVPTLEHPVPPPWLARVPAEGTFFGLTFRSRHDLEAPVAPARLMLLRNPELPPAAVVHLDRVLGLP